MKIKEKLIIFEGEDKVGKSSLINIFNKKTNFKYLVQDRSFVSSLVYNEIFNRDREKYYINIARTMLESFDIIFIFLHCTKDVQFKRLKDANETLPKQLVNTNVNNVYLKYFANLALSHFSTFSFYSFDTSNFLVDDLANILVNKIDNLERIGFKNETNDNDCF